ncbi:ADP-ribosylation factor-like 6 interacting protein 5a [Pholidichthys leucotaenia]
MPKVEVTPLRSWDDLFPGWERFGKPNAKESKDSTKWGNRVISNLLYYQTNYFILAVAIFLVVGLLNPQAMFTSMAIVAAIFLGVVCASESRAMISNFKRENPVAFLIAVIFFNFFLISVLGSILVFMLAISLPLALILAHASFRLRNVKNKVEFTAECVGLKRSPMGIILETLEQLEENIQKPQKNSEKKKK